MFKYELEQRVRNKLSNREGIIYSRLDTYPKNSQDKYLIEYDDCAGHVEDDCYIPQDEFEMIFEFI